MTIRIDKSVTATLTGQTTLAELRALVEDTGHMTAATRVRITRDEGDQREGATVTIKVG